MKRCKKVFCIAATTITLLCYAITAQAIVVNSYNWSTGTMNSVESSLFQYPKSGMTDDYYYCSYSAQFSSANAGLMKVVKWAPDTTVTSCTNMTAGSSGHGTGWVDTHNDAGVRQSYYWRVSGYETTGNCVTDIY